ncbi:MAG: AAA-associated domain-containing protein [Bacteroidota bacterium]
MRDLTLLDVVNKDLKLTELGNELINSDEKQQEVLLKNAALSLPKMLKIKELLNPSKRVTSKEIISKLPKDFFDGVQESSKVIYATKAMTWLK